MKIRTATAIAMAVTLVTVGLSAMPYAAASQNVDCTTHDFVISDDENNPNKRSLLGDDEIGLAEVSLLDGDQTLVVDVTDRGDDGVLAVEVFDESDSCNPICDFDIMDEDQETCDLDAPGGVGTLEYYVLLEETSGLDTVMFDIWHQDR